MRRHTIHVTEWDEWQARLELRCWCVAGDPCHTVTDESGDVPQLIDHCNAVEWFDNSDDGDLIHGRLPGEPPWQVDIEWTDDGPHIVAATLNEPNAEESL